MNVVSKFFLVPSLMLATHTASAGFADITVEWAPAVSAPIPTLGTWGLIAVALLMGITGVRMLGKRARVARVMSVGLIAGAVLLTAQMAETGPPLIEVSGGDCEGGTSSYQSDQATRLRNSCADPIQIVSYEFPDVLSCAVLINECPVGTVIDPEVGPGFGCPLAYFDFDGCL